MPVPHVTTQSCPYKAMGAIGIVMETHLQRDQAILTQIDGLLNLMGIPIPEMQLATILPSGDIVEIEALRERIRRSPLAAHHRIVPGLIPEIVIIAHRLSFLLPTPGNVELLVKQQEPTRAIALSVAQHRNHNLTIS